MNEPVQPSRLPGHDAQEALARLSVDQLQFSPAVVTRAVAEVVARFHVSACNTPVQGALVYATAVPYNQFDVPSEVTTDSDGWATITLRRTNGFPAARRQQLLAMLCFVCGSGFAVRGANTEAIPADRWAEIEARHDRERQRAEETGQPIREKPYADQRS